MKNHPAPLARTGTLWEGRYKSTLVQSSGYVLACYRYIEQNPVRAGMVQLPGAYRWSSYRANGLGHMDERLVPHTEYRALGTSNHRRISAYRALFESDPDTGLLDQIRSATNGNYVLGEKRFKDRIESRQKTRVRPGKPGRPKSVSA